MTETNNDEQAIRLWTTRNQQRQAVQKRENRAAAKSFLLAIVAIALALVVATYLAGLRQNGII